MTIKDLVDEIYRLNNIGDGFWKDYLDRIRIGMKVAWYPSSGFDLRPLHMGAYAWHTAIGREMQNTDLVYSDYGAWVDNYKLFMNIHNKMKNGTLNDTDMPKDWYTHLPTRFGDYFPIKHLESVEPFKIFADSDRETLLKYANDPIFMPKEAYLKMVAEQQYDGFAIKIRGMFARHITIIFLCLDDRLVEDLIEKYNIEIVALFVGDSGICGPREYGAALRNTKYHFSATNGTLINRRADLELMRGSEVYKKTIFKAIPELELLETTTINHPAHQYNILDHSLNAVNLVENPLLKMVLLLHDIGKAECMQYDENGVTRFWGHPEKSVELAEPILKRLHTDNIPLILTLIKYHDTPMDTKQKMNAFITQHGIEALGMLLEVQTADISTHAKWYAEKKLKQLRKIKDRYEKEKRYVEMQEDIAIQDWLKYGGYLMVNRHCPFEKIEKAVFDEIEHRGRYNIKNFKIPNDTRLGFYYGTTYLGFLEKTVIGWVYTSNVRNEQKLRDRRILSNMNYSLWNSDRRASWVLFPEFEKLYRSCVFRQDILERAGVNRDDSMWRKLVKLARRTTHPSGFYLELMEKQRNKSNTCLNQNEQFFCKHRPNMTC